MTIQLMIVDDHSVVRDGLRFLIELNEGFQVIGEAENMSGAFQQMEKRKPDILILDYKLSQGDGVIACREIKRRYPQVKVLVLTAFAEPHVVLEAIKAGADGYLLKNADHDTLIRALLDVYEGKSVLDPSVTDLVLNRIRINRPDTEETGLSERDEQVLDLMSQGLTNQEIAELLDITDKTVRNTISQIFKKIDVTNRTEAAAYWLKRQYKYSLPEQ
ncbi:MAG: response regulator transcription factor [Bacillota bacterium]|nr:response regulator transcription factor [Bacillota bacterium]MDW7677563.1 response regulator transcription factor [Bacillota bacterium]